MSRSSSRNTACGARGFTLLEVLIAFAILAIALVALFRAFGTGATNARLAQEYTVATLHAESIMAATGIESALAEGVAEGDLPGGYRWETAVALADTGAPAAAAGPDALSADPLAGRLYAVSVTVSWTAGGKTRSVSLDSYRMGAPP